MTKHCLLFWCALLCFTGILHPAGAEVIYDNGAPARDDGWDMTTWVEADDFVLISATRISGVKFWTYEAPGAFEGSIAWEIYRNSTSGTPGSLVSSGSSSNLNHSATGIAAGAGLQEFLITFDLPLMDLPAGTYWLALHNGPRSNNTTPLVFFWESTAMGKSRPSHTTLAAGGPWYSNQFPGYLSDLAFQLDGIPSPQVKSIGVVAGIPRLTFAVTPGQTYRIEYQSGLQGNWLPLPGSEAVSAESAELTVGDSDPNIRTVPHRFYRAVLR